MLGVINFVPNLYTLFMVYNRALDLFVLLLVVDGDHTLKIPEDGGYRTDNTVF